MTPSDEDIVARVRSGERDQFKLLMSRNNSRVYGVVRAIVQDASEAEDVVQDAYVRAYEHLGAFEGRARFSTWLTRIAVHEALARVRRRRRFDSLGTAPEKSCMSAPSASPEQQTSDVEMRPLLEAAVERLPEDFRSVFFLRAVERMSGAQAAQCLGISEEAVKKRLHRARNQLKEMLIESIEPSLRAVSEDLDTSKAQFRVLFDASPVPMWVYDPETLAFLTVNDAAVQHYGYRREEFAALTLEDIRPREDAAALREDIARHTDTSRVWRHRKKDGSVIAVEVKGHDFEFERKRARLVLAIERLRPKLVRAQRIRSAVQIPAG